MCATPLVSGQNINPECSVHVSLHQLKLFITRTPRQDSEFAVTVLARRPGRVARFIQSLAKSPVSLRTNQSPTNPSCWHSHSHCNLHLALAHVETLRRPPEPHNATHVVFRHTSKLKPDCFAVQPPRTQSALARGSPSNVPGSGILDGTLRTQTGQNRF